MLPDSESPIRRASQRRYSAWTLYARAFVGNRADADDIVRKSVNRAAQASGDLRSERHAHERVLGAIRTEALELLKTRQVSLSGDAPAAEPPTAQPSVLKLLTHRDSKADPRHVSEVAAEMLRELPRGQRRAIEMLLIRRPSLQLQDVARKRGQEVDSTLR